jgi:hypothetical protein
VRLAGSTPVTDSTDDPQPDGGDDRLSRLVPRHRDALPGRPAAWRVVRAWFAAPPRDLPEAAAVRSLLPDPELHWTPGLRRGTLAVLPGAGALTRVLLSWEWSVDAADFSVHSLEPTGWSEADHVALEAWLRAAAVTLQQHEAQVEAAVRRVVDDVTAGRGESRPADGTGGAGRSVEARLGTGVAGPDEGAAHPSVDVVLPAPDDPGREVFVDTATGTPLGERLTVVADGEAVAFRYVVAAGHDDVSPDDLVRWHDQHLHRQLLADDARQAAVHVVAGLEPPASIAYGG